MFVDRPHLRFDGVYVSRNTYIKRGIVEWRVRNACHVVCYFRYCRFSPDGTLLYRTSPEVPPPLPPTQAHTHPRRCPHPAHSPCNHPSPPSHESRCRVGALSCRSQTVAACSAVWRGRAAACVA